MLTVIRSAPRVARFRAIGLLSQWTEGLCVDGKKGIVTIEGVQGPVETNFSLNEAHKVLSQARKYHSRDPSIQGVQGDVLGLSQRSSLYGPMSVSESVPSRGYSTSAEVHHHQLSSQQGSQHRVYDEEPLGEPGAQGVQGDNCVTFRLWMENCQKYHLPNCDEQMEAVATGRKTLAQVFADQESIIREVAETYWRQQHTIVDTVDVQGVQDATFNIVADSGPCPQGMQGTDCANFKIWAHNCQEFGFGHCEDRLHDVVSGQRSLRDIFDEQEKLIMKVVAEHKLVDSKSPQAST